MPPVVVWIDGLVGQGHPVRPDQEGVESEESEPLLGVAERWQILLGVLFVV